jgi:hypothetical protein
MLAACESTGEPAVETRKITMNTNNKLNKVVALDGVLSPQAHLTVSLLWKSPERSSARQRKLAILLPLLSAIILTAGCASTKVSDRQQDFTGQLPKPAHIWVYNFVASAADVPADSKLAGEPDVDTTAQQTAEQIAEGRKLGAEIANQLAGEIRAMGLPGATAFAGATPQVNDIMIRGYLLSIQKGSAAKRVLIGFGSGESEMKTVVEGFQVTPTGNRELGSGTIDAGGGKSPGMALGVATFLATKNPVGLIVSGGAHLYGEESGKSTVEGRAKATAKEIADVLKKRFQEQGWIPAD